MFELQNGTILSLSLQCQKQVQNIRDTQARESFAALSGNYSNINYDKSRWTGDLVITTLVAADFEIMKQLSESKEFKILPGILAEADASHRTLPFISGGDVYVAGDLIIETSGRVANQSPYRLILPLVMLKEVLPHPADLLPGNIFSYTNSDGEEVRLGLTGELQILPKSLAKQRAAIPYQDGSIEKIDYDAEVRTAITVIIKTKDAEVYQVIEQLRSLEKFNLNSNEFARAISPSRAIDGLRINNLINCEIIGGLSITPAVHNYNNGVYQIEFNINAVGREDVISHIDIEFMRAFIEFMFNGENWQVSNSIIAYDGGANKIIFMHEFVQFMNNEKIWSEAA